MAVSPVVGRDPFLENKSVFSLKSAKIISFGSEEINTSKNICKPPAISNAFPFSCTEQGGLKKYPVIVLFRKATRLEIVMIWGNVTFLLLVNNCALIPQERLFAKQSATKTYLIRCWSQFMNIRIVNNTKKDHAPVSIKYHSGVLKVHNTSDIHWKGIVPGSHLPKASLTRRPWKCCVSSTSFWPHTSCIDKLFLWILCNS